MKDNKMEKKKKENKKTKGSERQASPDKNREKEEITEIFEVEKDGKEKTVEAHGVEEEKLASKGQIKKEKKVFVVIIILMIGLAGLFAAFYFLSDSFNHMNIQGVKFTIDKTVMAGKTLYKTSIPATINGSKVTYNFWLRGNPKITEQIPFEGNLTVMKNMVLNQTSNFNCNGDGIIGIANLVKLYNIVGSEVIADKNATCDGNGRYVFINIQNGNETKITQTGKTCYNIQVKDCEILPATERFMIETFIKIDKYVNS
jgi:hypothetical protein